MKNTTAHVNTAPLVFDQDNPNSVEQLKKFVKMINEYRSWLSDDVCYHQSQTRGQSKHRRVTIWSDHWRFLGELLYESPPYTHTAVISYCGGIVWTMKRVITLGESLPDDTISKVKFCITNAAKHYRENCPWCGLENYTDPSTGYHYEATYYNQGKDGFSIEESIRDPYGTLLWSAVCEGGCV